MTERRSRFASTLRLATCALAAGLACGFAPTAAGVPAYTPPPRPLRAKQPPVIARVIATSVHGDELIITIAAGSDSGVGHDWTAQRLRGEPKELFPGVTITMVRVEKVLTLRRIRASPDGLRGHSRVKLSPP